MKALLSSKGEKPMLWYNGALLLEVGNASSSISLSDQFIERDWRDKQKVVDDLRDTVEKQRKDLDSVRKAVMEKEMFCSALRVSHLFFIV